MLWSYAMRTSEFCGSLQKFLSFLENFSFPDNPRERPHAGAFSCQAAIVLSPSLSNTHYQVEDSEDSNV